MDQNPKKLEKDHLERIVEIEKTGTSAHPVGLDALKSGTAGTNANILKKHPPSEKEGTTRNVLVFLKKERQ